MTVDERCIHEMPSEQCGLCQERRTVRCRQCGRALKDVLSRALGVGPVCFGDDPRAQNRLFNEIQGWGKIGPFPPGSTAANWQNALMAIGIEAHVHTDADDLQDLYFNKEDL